MNLWISTFLPSLWSGLGQTGHSNYPCCWAKHRLKYLSSFLQARKKINHTYIEFLMKSSDCLFLILCSFIFVMAFIWNLLIIFVLSEMSELASFMFFYIWPYMKSSSESLSVSLSFMSKHTNLVRVKFICFKVFRELIIFIFIRDIKMFGNDDCDCDCGMDDAHYMV